MSKTERRRKDMENNEFDIKKAESDLNEIEKSLKEARKNNRLATKFAVAALTIQAIKIIAECIMRCL